MKISSRVIDYSLRTGKYFFFIVVVLLALNHWGVKYVSDEIINFFWFYLLINAFAVSAIIYRRYAMKSTSNTCPYCKGELQAKMCYTCPNCGDLKPEK